MTRRGRRGYRSKASLMRTPPASWSVFAHAGRPHLLLRQGEAHRSDSCRGEKWGNPSLGPLGSQQGPEAGHALFPAARDLGCSCLPPSGPPLIQEPLAPSFLPCRQWGKAGRVPEQSGPGGGVFCFVPGCCLHPVPHEGDSPRLRPGTQSPRHCTWSHSWI